MSRFLLNYAGQAFEITGDELETVRTAMESLSTQANARTALVSLQPNRIRTEAHLVFLSLGIPVVLTDTQDS